MKPPLRDVALLVLLCAVGERPVGAAIFVEIVPPGEARTVTFVGDARPDPCVRWSFAGRHGATLMLQGWPASPCTPTDQQPVELPALEDGRYRLDARLMPSGEIWERASFIAGLPLPAAPLVDLDPPAPGPGELLEVVISAVHYHYDGGVDFHQPATIEGDRIVFEGTETFCPFLCPPPVPAGFVGTRFVVPPLAPGLKVVELRIGAAVVAERALTVGAGSSKLTLQDRRFEVRLEWRGRDGVAHLAHAEALTGESGFFWFFSRDNVEMTVKILDGRAINRAFWLFAASMTDLEYTLTVIDGAQWACGPDEGCPRTRVYHGQAGQNHNVIDTELFIEPPIS